MRQIFGIISFFVTVTLLLVLQKPIFTAYVGGYTAAETLSAMWHGLSMDMSVAGYFTVIPAIAALVSIWCRSKLYAKAFAWYTLFVAVSMALAGIFNSALYPFWGFPLDYTPIFYITTSPGAAFASITVLQGIEAVVGVSLLALLYFFAIKYATSWAIRLYKGTLRRWVATILMLFVCAVLFVIIRGGVTVSTMNLSRVYFSSEIRLNHAAVNPVFSFLYSATHQDVDLSQFHYMDDVEAEAIFDAMHATASDSTVVLPSYPDIHLIIAESFSANLLPSLGGEPIAMRLDSIGRDAWSFTEAYASSFRTDRAITAILCGYPGLPTTSLLKYVDKLDGLPSLPRSLKDAGYHLTYYYGGDINFTNVNSLLTFAHFDRIISDKDFPVSQRLSKWGVPDHLLTLRALSDLQGVDSEATPRFTVLQTSSSHEPFDVPNYRANTDNRINAFMYTDSVIGAYVDSLRTRPDYDNALIVIVADHYGAYPETDDPIQRHRIPLIITGGAIDGIDPEDLLNRPVSQTDIAATILSLLGIDHSEFRFSNNMLDPSRRTYAVFSEPTWAAIVDGDNFAKIDLGCDLDTDSLTTSLAAYLQTLYNDFGSR